MKRKNFLWKDFYDLSRERQDKEIIRACREISMLTGLKLEDTVEHSYGLVLKPEHKLFGKIGIYDWISTNRKGDYRKAYFKFKGKRKSIEFNVFDEKGILSARNIIMILQEKEKLYLLFPDAFD